MNEQQQRAVQAGEGPILIIAGPGTGKTKTLTARIAHIIASGQAAPQHILALTFTNKAAAEMRSRVAQLTSGPAPAIHTFHALCHQLLGSDTAFVSDPQRLQIIKALPKPASLKGLTTRELGLLLSRAKNMPLVEDADTVKLVRAYNKALAAHDLRDFDDLLVQTYELLQQDEARRTAVQQQYAYILVDEFQDTNRLQYELLQLLCGHRNLLVIGDPNQSIYGFRGASGTIFEQFKADFPDALTIDLTINYRSVPQVVRLSNALFPDAPALTAHSTQDGTVRAVQVLNEYSEANWVLGHIQQAIGGGDMLRAISDDDRTTHRRLSDFAVLYRSRAAATAVQKAVAESGLPYQIVGDGSPYDHPHIQALLALLRAAITGEEIALEGFSPGEAKLVQSRLAQSEPGSSPVQLVEHLVKLLGFEITPELTQFINALVRFTTIEQAVAHFDHTAQQDFYDPAADAITLLTIHAAKGLEFPYVFVIGAEEGILPHARAEPDEERRLFYVAATRARECLDILYTQSRAGQPAVPSRFVTALDSHILPKMVDPNLAQDQRRAQKRQLKRSQQSLF